MQFNVVYSLIFFDFTLKININLTFAFSKQFEERIAAVTVDSVNAALRRMVVPENVTWILSGDLAKAGIKK